MKFYTEKNYFNSDNLKALEYILATDLENIKENLQYLEIILH